MRDKGAIKVICRLINLMIYVLVVFGIALYQYLEVYFMPEVKELFKDYLPIICVCAIPLIIMMIISLIIKYKLQNESKVTSYRILDTILRIVSTIPITFVAMYYINPYIMGSSIIVRMTVDFAIFMILNGIFKFTLKETLSVSFITSDNL